MNFLKSGVKETKVFSSLFKLVLSYLQVHMIIYSFDLNLPDFLNTIISSVGAPVGSLFYSLDCAISKVSSIPLIYVKLMWLVFSPIGYYVSLVAFGAIFL